jgi:hypothetical protein
MPLMTQVVTNGAFRREREAGKTLIEANGKRTKLMDKVTSEDPVMRVKALQDAQASGRNSPFISTTLNKTAAEKTAEALRARGLEVELLTIRGPRKAGVDVEAEFSRLGGRTKPNRMKDAELEEFGIPDLFIPGHGKSKSGFEIVERK